MMLAWLIFSGPDRYSSDTYRLLLLGRKVGNLYKWFFFAAKEARRHLPALVSATCSNRQNPHHVSSTESAASEEERQSLRLYNGLANLPVSHPGVRNQRVTVGQNALFLCTKPVFASMGATIVQPIFRAERRENFRH